MTKEAEFTIRFTVKLPDNVSRQQIEEWAKFKTGYNNFLHRDNPLGDKDLEAISCSLETF